MNKFLHSEKGGMDSTLMTIIGLFLVATLMFIVPLMSVSERNDDVAQSLVQTAVSDFVNNSATAGLIKPSDYEALIVKLNSTKNTFEVTIEVQHLDENPSKKVTSTSTDLVGENLRYSTFTSEILEEMYPSDGSTSTPYVLKKGDNIIVTVKNTNNTLAQQLRTFAYKVTGKGTYEIVASSSSMAVTNGKSD